MANAANHQARVVVIAECVHGTGETVLDAAGTRLDDAEADIASQHADAHAVADGQGGADARKASNADRECFMLHLWKYRMAINGVQRESGQGLAAVSVVQATC